VGSITGLLPKRHAATPAARDFPAELGDKQTSGGGGAVELYRAFSA
jgi:hypothetical protein